MLKDRLIRHSGRIYFYVARRVKNLPEWNGEHHVHPPTTSHCSCHIPPHITPFATQHSPS